MEPIRKGLFSRKWIVAFLVYIGLIAICCIAVYAVPSVKGILERTYIAEYGTVDVKDEVSAFIVRDETVYVTKYASKINRLAEADKLVKAGTRVIELTRDEKVDPEAQTEAAENAGEAEAEGQTEGTEETAAAAEDETDPGRYRKIIDELADTPVVTEDGIAREAGYVSYYVDGAEAKLNTKSFEGLQKRDYKSLSNKRAIETPTKKCGRGYPVFKIVSNSKWYLVFYLSNEAAEKYTEGGTVDIELNGEPVTVTVHRIESGTKTSRITLTCKSFFDGFLEMRSLDTKVTVSSAQGLVLEDASIVEAPDGKRGVFVKNKLGEHVFTPVSVKADDGVKCVVYSDIYVDADGNFVETIGTYDEIVASPSEDDIASLKKGGSSDKDDQN